MKILFFCLGNICRSPTAHGVMRQMVQDAGLSHAIEVESAGTQNWHAGKAPDARSQAHALRRGYDLSDLRAMQLRPEHFAQYDLLLAMDTSNHANALAIAPPELAHKLRYFTDFCSQHKRKEVPDPYYGGEDGFAQVLDLIEDGCRGLLAHCQTQIRA